MRDFDWGEMMFQVNDVVVYGAQGVCRIDGIQKQKMDGVIKEYFVLKPADQREAVFYVPTWNEKALAKMRKVLTKEDVDALIDSIPEKEPFWIPNENARKDAYRQILAGGDHAAVISMLQALYAHKQERETIGKRLHVVDDYFMREAEQLLYNEWRYVLNMDKAGLMTYIMERIEHK